MEEKDLLDLISKYKQGVLKPEERRVLFDWYNEILKSNTFDSFHEEEAVRQLDELDKQFHPHKKKQGFWRYAAAVAIFILGSWITYQWITDRQQILAEDIDIPAPSTKAYAFLTNGDSILLDDEYNTLKSINLSEDVIGTIKHNDSTRNLWITIKTPKSGKFQFLLPDGSAVWLNADSELSYPQTFGRHSREVKLIGEAYFEVTKQQDNSRRVPFIVRSARQDITVLGTKFNVNSYPNEPLNTTTLLEGSVEVNQPNRRERILLRPNEQSTISSSGIAKSKVQATDITAWMEGFLVLKELDLPDIARIIERNYNVSFADKNLPANIKMSGELEMDVNLNDLLHALEINTGLKFIRKGRSIMIGK